MCLCSLSTFSTHKVSTNRKHQTNIKHVEKEKFSLTSSKRCIWCVQQIHHTDMCLCSISVDFNNFIYIERTVCILQCFCFFAFGSTHSSQFSSSTIRLNRGKFIGIPFYSFADYYIFVSMQTDLLLLHCQRRFAV